MKSAYPPRTIGTGVDGIRTVDRGRLVGLDSGEEHEEQDHAELEEADEPLTLDLLAPDRFAHPLRQLPAPPRGRFAGAGPSFRSSFGLPRRPAPHGTGG